MKMHKDKRGFMLFEHMRKKIWAVVKSFDFNCKNHKKKTNWRNHEYLKNENIRRSHFIIIIPKRTDQNEKRKKKISQTHYKLACKFKVSRYG